MRGLFISFAIIMGVTTGRAQTMDWWANNVGWDGVTSWKRYLIFSPGFMGPNALPVPEMGRTVIDSISAIGATVNFHFSKGDPTQNIKLIGNFCIVKNIISADLVYIPMEWFQTTHEVKTERKVYYMAYNEKRQSGDVYLNLNLRIFEKWRKQVEMMLRLGYRFPTGSITGAARYTDSPGYYFDLTAGKPLSPGGPLKVLGLLGFYVWQTNQDLHFQDDAFVFGAGLEYNKDSWRIDFNSVGYLGYMNNGDKPVVVRIGAQKIIHHMTAILRLQRGLHDFDYTTLETGIKFHLGN
jgi:hypothetical protein